MTSKRMRQRITTTLYATYRAWEVALAYAEHTQCHADWNDVDWRWQCHEAVRCLNVLAHRNASDRIINQTWDALHVETKIGIPLTDYGTIMRRAYPERRPDALDRVNAFERRPEIKRFRAAQIEEIARKRAVADRVARSVWTKNA